MSKLILKVLLGFLIQSFILNGLIESCGDGYSYLFAGGDVCIECGKSSFIANPRITGGLFAVPHSWPAQVFIRQTYQGVHKIEGSDQYIKQVFTCGGTIIDSYTIITAAFCITTEFEYTFKDNVHVIEMDFKNNIYNADLESTFEVYLGASNLSLLYNGKQLPSPAVKMLVRKIIFHPKFDSENYLNDIALLSLENSIESHGFNDYIQPACLPNPTSGKLPQINSNVYAVGWGPASENGPVSDVLKNVALTVYDEKDCQNTMTIFKKDPESQICAGDKIGSKDACGDIGGGLYAFDTKLNKYILVGVISYGNGCGKVPRIFTRTSYFYNWLVNRNDAISFSKLNYKILLFNLIIYMIKFF